ncbi:MAG TPA: M56 family metallopeptidase, partial [Anaeromyxobacteraceae bacterium]|nr:M56 family metallopeptidase [Anaeromyxobacteraceae bacterium]
MIHAFVAALAIEALLRLWRARAPDDRLALRLVGLGQPLLVTPLLVLLVPARAGEDFHEARALFASRHFADLRLLGLPLLGTGVALAAALGTALFLMDALPLLTRGRRALPLAAPAPEALLRAVAEVASAHRVLPPGLHYVDAAAPALFCAGVTSPVVVVSRGALQLLDAEELRAALGHELAHLDRSDPALSWTLMGVRAVLFFNPVVQVVARAVTRDAEWRADECAGEGRLALASAILKLHRAGLATAAPAARSLPLAAALAEPLR